MEKILAYINSQFDNVYIPNLHITDAIEIIILAIGVYYVINWFRTTRAWVLLKGILVLLIFVAIAAVFKFNTILWLFKNTISVGVIAICIIFQPELRRALEQIGRKSLVSSIFSFEDDKNKGDSITKKTISEVVKASFEMSRMKTGALMVFQQEVALGEYIRTGIDIDALVTSQLILNIFEHNTPLHDGAVIIKNNRVVAATCYLPLTDSLEISKELGTRHRAGLGISEVSDSLTIIVSEETGNVSMAYAGKITRNLTPDSLTKALEKLKKQKKETARFKLWKGRVKNEK